MSIPGPDNTRVSSCVRDNDGNHVCYTNAGRARLLMQQLGLTEAPKPTPSKPGRTR